MPVPPHDEHPRRPETQRGALAVTDDLPHSIPIADGEVRALDAWFGDLLDELFGFEK